MYLFFLSFQKNVSEKQLVFFFSSTCETENITQQVSNV